MLYGSDTQPQCSSSAGKTGWAFLWMQRHKTKNNKWGDQMKKGEKLVIVGCSGSGGPAAMMAKKLMPEIDVTVIRKEEHFIVR